MFPPAKTGKAPFSLTDFTSSKLLTQVIPPEIIGYGTPRNIAPRLENFSNHIQAPFFHEIRIVGLDGILF
jgi:hypothetical protein